MNIYLITIFSFISYVSSRDFYVGMFKKNDWLVAQDRLFKERVPYRYMYAKYGRIFKCKITYFRVADRLGYGPGPKSQIVRGGLGHKYLVLRLTSPYNMPISVNIYVGCANKFKTTVAVYRANLTSIHPQTTDHTTRDIHKPDEVKPTEAACVNCTNAGQTTEGQASALETTGNSTATQ